MADPIPTPEEFAEEFVRLHFTDAVFDKDDRLEAERLASLIRSRDAAVRAAAIERVVLALCSGCNPSHVLENGRVWALCGASRLSNCMEPHAGLIPELEIADIIRTLGRQP